MALFARKRSRTTLEAPSVTLGIRLDALDHPNASCKSVGFPEKMYCSDCSIHKDTRQGQMDLDGLAE